MSDEYRRVLVEWARTHIPAHLNVQKITYVGLYFDGGINNGSTFENPSLEAVVNYLDQDGITRSWCLLDDTEEVEKSLSHVLNELFQIAEVRGDELAGDE